MSETTCINGRSHIPLSDYFVLKTLARALRGELLQRLDAQPMPDSKLARILEHAKEVLQ